MIKRLLARFRRDQGILKALVRVDFYPQDRVTPQIQWQRGNCADDLTPLLIYLYARILYELAELNEVRVARELMEFLEQVCTRVLAGEGPPRRPRLPLGGLRLGPAPAVPPTRSYRAEFFELHGGGFRLEFQGSLGKESFYLPAAYLALLQYCLEGENLADVQLGRLARSLGRLHQYYRVRRDFWEGVALTAAPVFALGTEELSEEAAPPV
jgi:hypothetical protein